MSHDPIVEEIHQIRERILTECGGDLGRLLERYRSAEHRDHQRIVTLEMVRERQRATSDRCAGSTTGATK
jgi:hypothetical protein